MKRWVGFFLSLVVSQTWAIEPPVRRSLIDLRAYLPQTATAAFQFGGERLFPITDFFSLRAVARLRQSLPDFDRFQYGAEALAVAPWFPNPQLGIFLRGEQTNQLSASVSFLNLALGISWEIRFFGRWAFRGRFGRVHRWLHSGRQTLLPLPLGADFQEDDFLLSLFFSFGLGRAGVIDLGFATLENLEIYRLNFPYMEAAWSPGEARNPDWRFFVRLQKLLGFGRDETVLLGVQHAL